MNEITLAYLTTALYSSIQDDGSPFDDDYGIEDFSPESVEAATKEISDFLTLLESENILWAEEISYDQFGYDFWLTRNHHGAGFWDRGLGELGKKLTEWAHSYGSSDVYLGDDGKIYLS
jgi:hypothetical protein